MIRARREAVTRATLTELWYKGAVEVVGCHIYLRDHKALEREAGAPTCSAKLVLITNMNWQDHGKSQASDGDFCFAEMAVDVLAIIQASGAHAGIPIAQGQIP